MQKLLTISHCGFRCRDLVTFGDLVTPGDPCKFILPWSSSPQIASLLCAEASCFEVFEPSDDFEPDLSVANVKEAGVD